MRTPRGAVTCWQFPRESDWSECSAIVLDENEFLSPYGIRSLSKFHRDHPYVFRCSGQEFRVDYVPGRIEHEPVWRQLQLARPDLVSRQLSADRGPGAVSLLLWRRSEGRVSHRLGPVDEPGGGGAGVVVATGETLSARPIRTGVRIKATRHTADRCAGQRGPVALPRVFSRRDRGRAGRQPPDGLDQPGCRLSVEIGPQQNTAVASEHDAGLLSQFVSVRHLQRVKGKRILHVAHANGN